MTSITLSGLGAGSCFSFSFFFALVEGLVEGGCFAAAGG